MAIQTEISWAGATWNPFFGCTKVGPGCDNCYAILEAHRKTANPKLPAYLGSGVTKTTSGGVDWTGKVARNSEKVWSLPRRTKQNTIFFVNSMSDLFHEDLTDADIIEVFAIMNECPQHTFQVLTKRPNRMVRMTRDGLLRWTPNIWAGVTIENDAMVRRADLLRKIPAHIRFISAEPLLSGLPSLNLDGIDWVIVGGESGPKARPMKAEWARDIRDRCIDRTLNGETTVFHFKQWGAWGPDGVKRSKAANGHILDGAEWHELPSKPVLQQHGNRSIAEFSATLGEARSGNGYKQIQAMGGAARVKLRDTVIDTLTTVGSMMPAELCVHNLTKVGLDPRSAEAVNIHAWALSDLVRKRRIRRVKVATGSFNRLNRPVYVERYEIVA